MQRRWWLAVLAVPVLAGCANPCSEKELAAVDFTPVADAGWEVSTPAEQGLDPEAVAQLYCRAGRLQTTHSVLVIKNHTLIAEGYFNGGAIDSKQRVQSVTKSVTSALAGIAVGQGALSVDAKMIDFFPEHAGAITDPRKKEITVRELLQMRAGYPWEESSSELFELLYHGFHTADLVAVPLAHDPGTRMEYSNLTAHLAAVVTARATGTLLRTYAVEKLFTPIGIEPGEWIADWEGNTNGHADLSLSARDMARFGQLYQDDGVFDGKQIVPASWVHDSLQPYSTDVWPWAIGKNFADMRYGYLWWSARAGDRHFDFAWGHGGQSIVLVDDLALIVVVTADPLVGQHGDAPWDREKENLNLAADFVASLP